MSENPTQIAREAKNLHQGLKDLLKIHDPWEREVEYQRKQLRRRHLLLLLCHPYAKESQDAENHLWMQTSYAFISAYKQRVTALDKHLAHSSRQQSAKDGHGPVEQRKLLNRFKQFLAEEEKFWIQLIARIQRSFDLVEARPALAALGISIMSAEGAATAEGNPRSNSSNQQQFPAEDATSAIRPQTLSQRESRLAVLSKALIRLGDIARYRELYNESGGRPKAGREEGSRKNGRARRGGAPAGMEAISRPRNYERAALCYQQSKNLQPDDGNPSHQLAILASYQKDTFASLLHYYRSLCVLRPAEMASENMSSALAKALDAWRAKWKDRSTAPPEDQEPPIPHVRVGILRENVVALHALWRIDLDRADTIAPNLSQLVLDDFTDLVSERLLPADMITPLILMAQGALYERQRTERTSTSNTRRASQSQAATALELRQFTHLLSLYQVLLEVGSRELEDPLPKDNTDNDPAQRITATFRRTLPAMRVASRWLRVNVRYVVRIQESRSATRATTTSSGTEFWTTYARFACMLARAFPKNDLPSHQTLLEEDLELKGFLPLGEGPEPTKACEAREKSLAAQDQVHPNVEQLMRIADLLSDAQSIAVVENSPIGTYDTLVSLSRDGTTEPASATRERAATLVPNQNMVVLDAIREDKLMNARPREDDMMTEGTTRTEDDPVREAFRKVLNGSDLDPNEQANDDDDEIVWDLRPSASPAVGVIKTPSYQHTSPVVTPQKPQHPSTTSSIPPNLSPTQHQPVSPPHQATLSAPTTAQDLLNNVMSGVSSTRRGSDALRPPIADSKLVQSPPLLFGASPSNQPGSSIWSSTGMPDWHGAQDPRSGVINGVPAIGDVYPHDMGMSMAPPKGINQGINQAPWPSTFMANTPVLHQAAPGLPHGHPYHHHHPQQVPHPTHQRTLSTSLPHPDAENPGRQNWPSMSHAQLPYLQDAPRPIGAYPMNPVVHSPALMNSRLGGLGMVPPNNLPHTTQNLTYHTRHISLAPDGQAVTGPPLPVLSHTWGQAG